MRHLCAGTAECDVRRLRCRPLLSRWQWEGISNHGQGNSRFLLVSPSFWRAWEFFTFLPAWLCIYTSIEEMYKQSTQIVHHSVLPVRVTNRIELIHLTVEQDNVLSIYLWLSSVLSPSLTYRYSNKLRTHKVYPINLFRITNHMKGWTTHERRSLTFFLLRISLIRETTFPVSLTIAN